MQSINVAVFNPLFLGTFFGTAILCVALAIAALVSRFGAGAGYLLAGSLNYFVGSILVTMICNVPLNNKLASVKPDSTEGKTVDAIPFCVDGMEPCANDRVACGGGLLHLSDCPSLELAETRSKSSSTFGSMRSTMRATPCALG